MVNKIKTLSGSAGSDGSTGSGTKPPDHSVRKWTGLDDRLVFWGVLAAAVVLTVIGMLLGNPFEDYQTSSTL